MNKYILEHENEHWRLEVQSQLENYNLTKEFKYLILNDEMNILDAGCGSGLLGRFLTEKNSKILYAGGDASQQRLEGARSLSPHLNFHHLDLYDLESFKYFSEMNVIVNRYVLHHLPNASHVIDNFYKVLPVNGLCYIVDIDGLLLNMGTTDVFLQSCFQILREKFYGRLEHARYIPSYMKAAGFKNIEWRVQLMEFQGENKFQEALQFKERFKMAEEHLVKYFGTEFVYKKFVKHFFEEIQKPSVCLYYNKVISWGNK